MRLKGMPKNIVDAEESLIIHGCNAQGVMGSGVALSIKLTYPQAYQDYKELCERGILTLGKVNFVRVYEPTEKVIANIITQQNFGNDGQKYASYEALVMGLRLVREYCKENKIDSIASPRIGCGLGGLNQEFVYSLLEECLVDHGISVTIYSI